MHACLYAGLLVLCICIDKFSPTLIFRREFYFSDRNLKHDNYLRAHMDSNGFVPIEVLSQFPRIMSLAPNASAVAGAISGSKALEVQENRVRLRVGWQQYVAAKAT